MEPQTAVIFTRLGLVFDFLAFFFAAPEILGEERLKELLKHSSSFLWWFSGGLFILTIFGAASFIIIYPILFLKFSTIFVTNYSYRKSLFPASFFLNWVVNNSDTLIRLSFISAGLSWLPKILMKLSETLLYNERTRRTLLNLGLFLFIIGVISQFIGTF